MIVGIDSRSGENANMGAGDTDDADGARSDTVMLVNIPANRKRVVAVSFPRDLAITPMQCEAWNPEHRRSTARCTTRTPRSTAPIRNVYTETKLNSTFSFGGPKCLVKEIQKLSGLSINRFIAIDFVGFARMVEALGGVEVCSTTPLEDYELGTVLANSGRQMVDGHTALNYVRARQVTTELNGDYGRIKRQQLFLSPPAAVADLPGHLLLAVEAQQRRQHVHQRQLCRQHRHQGPRRPRPVAAGYERRGRVTFVTVPTTGITDENR